MIELELPYPPSINHYKTPGAIRRTKDGKIYQRWINSRETIGYFYQVYMRAKQQLPSEGSKFASSSTKLGVTIFLHPPDKRKRDIDNPLKVLLDALVHSHIIKDDSFITRLFVQKLHIIEQGLVNIQIYEVE